MLRDPGLWFACGIKISCRMVVASSAAVLGYTAQAAKHRNLGRFNLPNPNCLQPCSRLNRVFVWKSLREAYSKKNVGEAAIVIMLLFMAWLVKVPVQRISITVDGSEIRRENQLRLVVYAIIYGVLPIPGWLALGFLPSTAGLDPHVGFSHIFCHMLHRAFSLVEIRKDTFRWRRWRGCAGHGGCSFYLV